MRLEVSLPAGVDSNGKIIGWDNRLVLDEVNLTDQFVEARNDEITPEILRKLVEGLR